MPISHIEMTDELVKRIEVLEAQYESAEQFADAMGVHPATIRYWKAKTKKMTRPSFLLLECREREKLPSKRSR